MDNLRQTFADNLEKHLEQNGMTQAELAERLDISAPTVSQWMRLRTYPTIDKLETMARIFGCNVTDLMLPPVQVAKELRITDKEQTLLVEYRKADEVTKQMIDRLLSYTDRILSGNKDGKLS